MRLTTSNVPVANITEPFDVAIRGSLQARPGYVRRAFLPERRMPVCSPALLARSPLHQPEDLRNHILLHSATLDQVWPQWLTAAGVPDLKPRAVPSRSNISILRCKPPSTGSASPWDRSDWSRTTWPTVALTCPFSGPSLPAPSLLHLRPRGERAGQGGALVLRLADGDCPEIAEQRRWYETRQ